MQQITCEEYKAIQASGEDHIVLDVREHDEWNAGHIEGAVHLPLGLIPLSIHTVLPDKDARIITCCRTGGRSGQACQLLEKMGYTNITNLDGGYLGYCEA